MKSEKLKLPFVWKWKLAKFCVPFLRPAFRVLQKLPNRKLRDLVEKRRFLWAEKPFDANAVNPNKPNILVFFDRIPMPDKDSSSVRMLAILQILTKLYNVFFVSIYQRAEHQKYLPQLEKIGVQILSVFDFEKQLQSYQPDVTIFAYPFVAKNTSEIVRRRFPRTKTIFDTVDVHFVRLEREAKLKNDDEIAKQAAELKQIEISETKKSDQIWCVTQTDKDFLHEFVPSAKIEIIPNIHQLYERGKNFAERRDLLFIGGFAHRPNVDAVFYFVEEILPKLLEKLPEIRFHIVGSECPPEIYALASENVVVHGFVPEVENLFASCRVFVSPLRYGGGMKGKIGQSMAFGLPVVTTSIGAEGMNLRAENEVLLADAPSEFVSAILRVYDNERLWQSLADNSYEFIAENFSPEAVAEKMKTALQKICPDKRFQSFEQTIK